MPFPPAGADAKRGTECGMRLDETPPKKVNRRRSLRGTAVRTELTT
jgi:hypothetical protein